MVLSFFVAMDSFSRSFAARDAGTARLGALLATVLMLPIALAVAWLGLAAAVLYPDPASTASILATFVVDRFPVGLKGLMVIGILSAVMSVASISVLTASANYARDIHQRYLRPNIPPPAMLRIGALAALGAGALGLLMAWRMRDIIDLLQFGFTLNSAGLFLPTVAALFTNRVPASAAFWSTAASLATVVAWRIAADAGAGGVFAIDPLWPGLAVSALLLVVLTALQPRRVAGTAA
jgi:SSS family solute:Na+ symporter